MLTLFSTPLSANGRKVLAVARHLWVDAHVENVNVYAGEGQRPEYLSINPTGKIPALLDGDFLLTESNAIAIYLAEVYGGDRLWSRDPKRRAAIARWLYWEAAHWQPALTALLAAFVGRLVVPSLAAMPEPVVDWSNPFFVAAAWTLERETRVRPFLCGGEPTLADFGVAGMMTYARAAKFPW